MKVCHFTDFFCFLCLKFFLFSFICEVFNGKFLIIILFMWRIKCETIFAKFSFGSIWSMFKIVIKFDLEMFLCTDVLIMLLQTIWSISYINLIYILYKFVVSLFLRYIPSKKSLKNLVFEILGQRSEKIFSFSLLTTYYQKMVKKNFLGTLNTHSTKFLQM